MSDSFLIFLLRSSGILKRLKDQVSTMSKYFSVASILDMCFRATAAASVEPALVRLKLTFSHNVQPGHYVSFARPFLIS